MFSIKLKTKDEKIFEVDIEVIKRWGVIENVFQLCQVKENSVIPLPNVEADILSKLLEWSNHHKNDAENDETPLEESSWDVKFLDVDQETLFGIINAANCLDIRKLFIYSCKTVANMIKGKSPDQIRALFDIIDDFFPDDE